jgi:hypothetical protein
MAIDAADLDPSARFVVENTRAVAVLLEVTIGRPSFFAQHYRHGIQERFARW